MGALSLTFVASAVGSADTAEFLIRRPSLFREKPGRAAGSVAALLLWTTLGTRAAMEGPRASAWTRTLAASLLGANLAVLGVHLRHRIAGPRVFVGAAAATVALVDSLRR